MWGDTGLSRLVGRELLGWGMEAGERAITIHTELDGKKYDLDYRVEGECCSESWLLPPDWGSCLGGLITSVEARDEVPGNEEEGRQECVRVYGFDIHTTKGTAYLEFRNASNGYYGGTLFFVREVDAEVRTGALPPWGGAERP